MCCSWFGASSSAFSVLGDDVFSSLGYATCAVLKIRGESSSFDITAPKSRRMIDRDRVDGGRRKVKLS